MQDISKIDHQLNADEYLCRAIIETLGAAESNLNSSRLPGCLTCQRDPVQSTDYAGIKKFEDLNEDLQTQIKEYLELYNKNSDTDDKVTGIGDPRRAVQLVKESSGRLKAGQAG